jgi:hypothetical protein
MDKAGRLLPWIMGGLMIVAVAVAIAVSSTNRHASTELPALSPIATEPQPANVLAPTSTPAPVPASETVTVPAMTAVPAAQIETVAPPVASSGQIWQCTIDGVKTFSSKPCGDKSSLREIGPVNRMDPTPVIPYARSYEPESRYQPEYSYPGDQENLNPPVQEVVHSYPVFIGIPIHERRRPDHAQRPPVHGHYRVPPPPKMSGSH